MALPEYVGRAVTAAAQVLTGSERATLEARLAGVRVGVTFGVSADHGEGSALLDLIIRVVARFYPTLVLRGPERRAAELADLARAINKHAEFVGEATIEIVIGDDTSAPSAPTAPVRIFAGSDQWNASVGIKRPYATGASENPFGAGAAACLATSNLFRALFLPDAGLDADATLSTYDRRSGEGDAPDITDPDLGDVVLAGTGAIGHGAIWALARAPLRGRVHLVDDEDIDRDHNLPRYVLALEAQAGQRKVQVARDAFKGDLVPVPHDMRIEAFFATCGYSWERVLLALDSARDRRAAQASLPRRVVNAWTQPGDLGVSVHSPFGEAGACVRCLYLPEGPVPSEDELIADALRIPERVMQVRSLLHNGSGVARDLLEVIAAKFEIAIDPLLPFEGKPLRQLYTEGLCAGVIIPIDSNGTTRETHIPLPHQSALAGVLMAAALVRDATAGPVQQTEVTRVNVLRTLAPEITSRALRGNRGICICSDSDYVRAYRAKYV
jgi:hypothetical protein